MRYLRDVFLALIVIILLGSGCKKLVTDDSSDNPQIPATFTYQTNNTLSVRFEAILPTGEQLNNRRCILSTNEFDDDGLPTNIIVEGFTENDGVFETTIEVPFDIRELYMQIAFFGIKNAGVLNPSSGNAVLRLGQGVQQSFAKKTFKQTPKKFSVDTSIYSPNILYMGTWDSRGTPDYLAADTPVPADVLISLNNALPEEVSVFTYHPEYVATGNETNAVTIGEVDLSVIFLHEGTGYPNSFGYYTYPVGNPPATEEDINLNIIFPHVEYEVFSDPTEPWWHTILPGNTVSLGTIPANTEVGWGLLFDSFILSNSTIDPGYYQLYSDPQYNEVVDPAEQQHMVMIKDLAINKVFVGFEQLRRDNYLGKMNDDFNDIVVFFDADSLDLTDVPPVETPPDCDNDGIPDYWDEFPCDPRCSYIIISDYKTLAIEDDWPTMGDKDFNDLVISYKTEKWFNSSNEITDLFITLLVRAAGSDKNNGFGFELNTLESNIKNLTGSQLTTGNIQLSPNGTELGSSNAVIIVFDDVLSLISPIGGATTVNTQEGYQASPIDTINLSIEFDRPLSDLQLNPFIFVDGERGREIHLNNYPPTQMADNSYFNTVDDASDTTMGIYYRTADNNSWALELPLFWEYPFEGRFIDEAYYHYNDWRTSGGSTFTNWYISGYAVQEYIYKPYGLGKGK
ncbi:MAG: LruC domain-containing protein [Calditrichae bacterium]|nr:LruC domain-containing protein [Calditrichia bacterium]